MTQPVTRRPVHLIDTVKAVLWSFLGLRRRADFERDVQQLNPIAVLATGVVMAFVFIIVLMVVVRWVVAA